LLKAALSGALPFTVSPLLALEYEGVLHKKIEENFLKISREDCGRILSALFAKAEIVWRPLQIRPTLSGSSDDKILECAVSSDCTHIVTFNKRHFPAAATAPWGIQVMTAGEFLLGSSTPSCGLLHGGVVALVKLCSPCRGTRDKPVGGEQVDGGGPEIVERRCHPRDA